MSLPKERNTTAYFRHERIRRMCFALLVLVVLPAVLLAQTPSLKTPATERPQYLLGPDDQITIQALHVPDITDKPIRIDHSGYITLPLAGRVKAAGLSVEQLQSAITARLDEFIQEPEVSISVIEMKSQPISVTGSVTTPGVYQLQGEKTLLEMLSMAGGPKTDAADVVRITRRTACTTVPLPNVRQDRETQLMIGEVSLKTLFEAKSPVENVPICSGDVITLPRAQLIYVLGDVHKPGGFALRDKDTASVLQAVSLAEGLLRTAASTRAEILRTSPEGGKRKEIAVNLKAVMQGRAPDIALQPDDILVVPNSASKAAMYRAVEAAVQVAVWRSF
jgi:polysaccharide export outer membrane protein